MSHQTLQINTIQALERLIGGDTALELEIRQNVVEAFAKKHLKGLMSEFYSKQSAAVIESVKADSEKIIKEVVASYLKSKGDYWAGHTLVITQEGKDVIKNAAHQQVKVIFDEAIQLQLATLLAQLPKIIEKKVNDTINFEVAKQVKEGIANKLQQLKESI